MNDQNLSSLQTIRDWTRFAVSQFNRAGLAYGHGTATAVDEAMFLILSTLHLDIGDATPWLDARLTQSERKAVAEIIERRVVTRKPASYLTNTAWIGPHKFHVDERVIVPRSFIGELMVSGAIDVETEPRKILDLCCGSGCLGIIAAHLFEASDVLLVDLSPAALDVAKHNIDLHAATDRVTIRQSDLFGALDGEKFDLIISNPPYVRHTAVLNFPPEHAAEPAMAHDGGADGLDLVRRIIAAAPDHLTPDGQIIMEIGIEREALEAAYPQLPFLWLDTQTSEGEVFVLRARDFTGRTTGNKRRKSSKK